MKNIARYAYWAGVSAVFLCSTLVHAKYNGEERGRPVMPATANATFQQECAGCHVPYAPGLLPAASWTKIMGGLDKHFGVDASLSAAENKTITDFLVKNASNRWTAQTAPLRRVRPAHPRRRPILGVQGRRMARTHQLRGIPL